MASLLDVLLLACDKVLKAHGVFVANGGGSWKRHVEPAIYELRKVSTRIEKRRQREKGFRTDPEFRTELARMLYEMFEMRTNKPWDEVGPGGSYGDMHTHWLDCADELILRVKGESVSDLVYMSGPPEGIAADRFTNGPVGSLAELNPDEGDVVVVKNARGDVVNRFSADTGEIYE